MKKLITLLLIAFATIANAQIHNPVKWKTAVEKINDNEYYLVATASIEAGWKLYGQNIPPNGPVPTSFKYTQTPTFELVGKTEESKPIVKHDKVFDMEIAYFYKQAVFKQRIKLLGELTSIKAEVEFMSCNDSNCLPPDTVDLEFFLSGTATANQGATPQFTFGNNTDANNTVPATTVSQTTPKVPATTPISRQGLWTIFFISFLSGFAALLTPCVFPMIPMTVSYFTKQSKTKAKGIKNAVIYGISIIVIYVLLGSVVTAIFGADVLNALASNSLFNLIFFLILVVFAISFLGAFEITLPSSWSTKIDAQADRSGFIGIFFMALALAIVSFSCTGPIVGSLLVQAASQGGIAPIMGMFGFSLAIALPFALFAAFPGWLHSLPKSGGWMNTVKVVLGFLELALAFKFLSIADLVWDLHWLEREVFIAIWIAIFGALSLYLFGKIRLPHDDATDRISVGRLLLGLVSLSFTVYLIPGLWGAPLSIISGFPPPQYYSESPYGVGHKGNTATTVTSSEELPQGAHLFQPYDIVTFNDYQQGLEYAKQVGKPVLLDFTGKSCVNCRKMEDNVWGKPEVLNILKNKVVLISLLVDDKNELPENEVKPSKIREGKMIKTIGQKWSEFQALRYHSNSQPLYVLMGHDEQNLVPPVGYTPDVEKFSSWLHSGISAFGK
ncbi:thiol:disulfide interchange protein [Capnocytophaga sp. oral taxon 326]|uniref:thiol:disulfide interchange protein n=1 Tax=Capnocytophaga sp. oral taxon 326 TaxID=712212 RepID=UPI0002A3BA5A|nr:thiol:disulfide interchange protein [Capnocytophaga sp. oral taxon 326]EKY17563.1 cytochrome C biogenesis protein transmembrane region [Capnocytophaga sp. oral taxon 326 str. F0382]